MHDSTLQSRIDPRSKHDFFDDPATQVRRIAVNHFNYIARPMAASGVYDIVFYGHDHSINVDLDQRLINPGMLKGYNPLIEAENKEIDATFVSYDTAARHVSKYKIETKIQGGPGAREVIPFLLDVDLLSPQSKPQRRAVGRRRSDDYP